MAFVASTTRDFSRLYVSDQSPTLVFELGPLDIFGAFPGSSISFPVGRRGKNNKVHSHKVIIMGQTFTVDGGEVRHAKNPDSQKFLESIKNYQLPEEFSEEGMHMIRVATVMKLPRKGAGEDVQDEHVDDFKKLMSMGGFYVA